MQFVTFAFQSHGTQQMEQAIRSLESYLLARGGLHLDGLEHATPNGDEVIARVLERRSSLDMVLEEPKLYEELPDGSRVKVLREWVHWSLPSEEHMITPTRILSTGLGLRRRRCFQEGIGLCTGACRGLPRQAQDSRHLSRRSGCGGR